MVQDQGPYYGRISACKPTIQRSEILIIVTTSSYWTGTRCGAPARRGKAAERGFTLVAAWQETQAPDLVPATG